MSLTARVAKAFGLSGEDAWRRHANPWSVYSRIPVPLLLVFAIWSRVWLGWWSLVPVGIVVLWTIVNPRVFPPPRSMDSWASRAVMGEQVWARRSEIPVPDRHLWAPIALSVLSAAGLPFLVWGLIALEPWVTALGLVIQTSGKMWFLDRMVWLYDDVSSGAEPVRRQTDR